MECEELSPHKSQWGINALKNSRNNFNSCAWEIFHLEPFQIASGCWWIKNISILTAPHESSRGRKENEEDFRLNGKLNLKTFCASSRLLHWKYLRVFVLSLFSYILFSSDWIFQRFTGPNWTFVVNSSVIDFDLISSKNFDF
jgi:hypothetical protein